MKKQKIQDAIDIIENAGGIVMMPDDQDLPEISEDDVLNEQHKREFQERKQQACDEFDELLGSENFSFQAVEEICYANGVEMDYIEEHIHNMY